MLAMKPLTVIEEPMDTIGKRIKLAMVENELKQVDILDHFRREGREISKAQMSKIINDGAIMYTPDMLIALGKILKINLHYLLTGEEIDSKTEQFMTDEANAAGALIDAVRPADDRKLLQATLEKIMEIHPEHWEFVFGMVSDLVGKIDELDTMRRTYAGELFEAKKRKSVAENADRLRPRNGN